MNLEELRHYCLSKKSAEETFPFGKETLVYKVCGKVFLLCGMDETPLSFNVKAAPGNAIEQRERYPSVIPGYHMNKKHWNTVQVDGSVGDKLLKEWIDDSYGLVVSSLSKKEREKIL